MGFSKAANSSPSTGSTAKRRKPINLGVIGGIIALPLLLVVALVSIPVTPIVRSVRKQRYERFKKRMRESGRVVSWEHAESQKSAGNGTLIFESETMKGPWYLWWTPEQIAEKSPFPFPTSLNGENAAISPKFNPFRQWCYQNYLDSISGKALLVEPVETSVLERLFHDNECVKVCGVKSMRKN